VKPLSTVGKSLPRVDARDKVTGRAEYAYDLRLPGMLHAKVLRSAHAHARIVSIDTSKAEALPGVKAVITGADQALPAVTDHRLRQDSRGHHGRQWPGWNTRPDAVVISP
jgi:CO/xanthine dehydrogenase Mo-binding subunit